MLQKSKIVTLGEILVEFVSHKKNCGLHEITNFSGPFPSGAPAILTKHLAWGPILKLSEVLETMVLVNAYSNGLKQIMWEQPALLLTQTVLRALHL